MLNGLGLLKTVSNSIHGRAHMLVQRLAQNVQPLELKFNDKYHSQEFFEKNTERNQPLKFEARSMTGTQNMLIHSHLTHVVHVHVNLKGLFTRIGSVFYHMIFAARPF